MVKVDTGVEVRGVAGICVGELNGIVIVGKSPTVAVSGTGDEIGWLTSTHPLRRVKNTMAIRKPENLLVVISSSFH